MSGACWRGTAQLVPPLPHKRPKPVLALRHETVLEDFVRLAQAGAEKKKKRKTCHDLLAMANGARDRRRRVERAKKLNLKRKRWQQPLGKAADRGDVDN